MNQTRQGLVKPDKVVKRGGTQVFKAQTNWDQFPVLVDTPQIYICVCIYCNNFNVIFSQRSSRMTSEQALSILEVQGNNDDEGEGKKILRQPFGTAAMEQ